MVAALLSTVFAQDNRAECHQQWRLVADQLREKYPKIAALMTAVRMKFWHTWPSPRLIGSSCTALTVNALLDLLHARLHFALGEVTVAIIDGFELAAVDADDRLREEIEVSAKHYELTADVANGFAVVFAKVGNGLEVLSQTTRGPHQLDVALGLTFKPAAGLNPIEIAVDVDLQQDRGMIGRATGYGRIGTLKIKCAQVEFIDENVDHSDWIFFG